MGETRTLASSSVAAAGNAAGADAGAKTGAVAKVGAIAKPGAMSGMVAAGAGAGAAGSENDVTGSAAAVVDGSGADHSREVVSLRTWRS